MPNPERDSSPPGINALDDMVWRRTVEFVKGFEHLGTDAYVVEAIMKMVLRDICIELHVLGADCDDIADHLATMIEVLREKGRDERQDKSSSPPEAQL